MCYNSPIIEKGGIFIMSDFNIPDFSNLNLNIPDYSDFLSNKLEVLPTPVAYSYSDTQYEILKKYIQDFESKLDADYEVALLLTHFGHSILMNVTEISYEESVLLIFKGYVNGKMSTLIQHISQLNFLLTSVPKEPERPARRVGFYMPETK